MLEPIIKLTKAKAWQKCRLMSMIEIENCHCLRLRNFKELEKQKEQQLYTYLPRTFSHM